MSTISINLELNATLIGAVMVSLFLFAVLYDLLVSRLGDLHYGYTSFLVAGGVGMTLGAMAVICWQAAFLAVVCFMVSGIPMIVGEAIRTKRQQMNSIQRMQAEALRNQNNSGEMSHGEGSN